MANDPKSRWAQHQKTLPTAAPDTKEMSLNERLKLVRGHGQALTDQDGLGRNRFGDTERRPLEQPEPQPRWKKASVPAHVGHTKLDPQTLAAKEAFEASKQSAQDRQAQASRTAALSQISEEDCSAILTAFFTKHPDFHPSAFNVTNLMRGLAYCVEQGAAEVTGMNIRSLEVVWDWLAENGFTEKAKRYRGEPAARVFNPPAPQEPEPLAQKTVTRTVITAEERAELKDMNFDELQQQARAGFKSPKPNQSDYRG